MHDAIGGVEAAKKKQDIQLEIEQQSGLGEERLDEQDKYLLGNNLEDLETSLGKDQYYWLLSIHMAREDSKLKEKECNSVRRIQAERRAYTCVSVI